MIPKLKSFIQKTEDWRREFNYLRSDPNRRPTPFLCEPWIYSEDDEKLYLIEEDEIIFRRFYTNKVYRSVSPYRFSKNLSDYFGERVADKNIRIGIFSVRICMSRKDEPSAKSQGHDKPIPQLLMRTKKFE